MAKLVIEYSELKQTAILRIINGNEGWAQIRRVCEDESSNTQILGPSVLEIPWWAFLSVRERIGYYVQRYSLGLDVSENAKNLLHKALARVTSYREDQIQKISEKELPDLLQSAGFERVLTMEQTRNVAALLKYDAAATFSVPGAGKTTEALAYFVCKKTWQSKLLVICPKNAFAVWEEQITDCIPRQSFNIIRLIGGRNSIALALEKNPDVALITYQQVPNVIDILGNFLVRYETFLFLDESHRIKGGINRVIPTAIFNFSHLAYIKLILSGTPMPNSINDLCPQFTFLYPEIRVDENNIRDLFQPIFVRTTKKELGLPKIKRRLIPIRMNQTQKLLYNLLCSELARQTQGGLTARDRNLLRTIGKSALTLIQLVSNPALLARRTFQYKDMLKEVLIEGDSPKLQYVTTRARQLARKGKKVIIWSSFVANVELVANRLVDLGADYIHGGVEAGSEEEDDTREAKIKRFHDDSDCYVLVANPAACGEGISLHKVCHNAIYLDRNYNAAQYLQSEDRIHRLGLAPDATTEVEILCCQGTIDVSVNKRLTEKVRKMAEVLNDREINIDPIPLEPDEFGFDLDDLTDFIDHIKIVAQGL